MPAYLGPQHVAARRPRSAQGPGEPEGIGHRSRCPSGNARRQRKALRRGVSHARGRPQAGGVWPGGAVDALQRARAFNLDEEPASLRDAYGRHKFGQSCLLARRLVEAGVSFVEVFRRGWDDHGVAAKNISARAPWLDAGMAMLIRDLKERGMLDDTLVVWMGEFGRTPGDGNGHFCNAWSTVWAGGGIKTGQVVGKTSETGKNARLPPSSNDPSAAPDYIATLCLALGIDIHQEFDGPGNRPMPLVEKNAKPIKELLS